MASSKACEAWQKDAKEAKEQAKVAEAERQLAEQKGKDAELKLKELQGDFDTLCRSPSTPLLRSYGDLDQLPLPKLHSIQNQLRSDLELIDGVRSDSHRPTLLTPCLYYRCRLGKHGEEKAWWSGKNLLLLLTW